MKIQVPTLQSLKSRVVGRNVLIIILIGVCTIMIASFLSLIPIGASEAERMYATDLTLNEILQNPINAPHKLVTFAVTNISGSVRAVRMVSLAMLCIAAVAMYYALRHWHEPKTAALTTLAFSTNAVTLGIARLGQPLILMMSFFVFVALILWHMHSHSNKLLPLITIMSVGLLLYVPGFLWFMTIIGFVYVGKVKEFFVNVKRPAIIIGLALGIALTIPLLMSFVRDINNLKAWLLLPATFEPAAIIRGILRVPSALLYHMPLDPSINAGRLPVFDIASGLLFLLGVQAYIRKITLDRTRVMIGGAMVAIIAGAFGHVVVAVTLLLPFVFCVVAAGIEYLLDEWKKVFPKNPIASSFSVIFLTSCIMLSMYYQLSRFLVVWPSIPEVRETYDQARIINPDDAY